MTSFKTRISKTAKNNGKIILANDYDFGEKNLETKTISNMKKLHPYICAIKINFHLLLPLSPNSISKIIKTAHSFDLQTIADIKLNDIGNTNHVTAKNLWNLGFDAIIVNPIMGLESLQSIVKESHKNNKGIISLCHMSAPEAKLSYDMSVISDGKKKLYQLFLEWAIKSKVDGIVVGATFPNIISECKKNSFGKTRIYSPGVGTQGGDAKTVLGAGSDYLIVGRTIINAKDPVAVAKSLSVMSTN